MAISETNQSSKEKSSTGENVDSFDNATGDNGKETDSEDEDDVLNYAETASSDDESDSVGDERDVEEMEINGEDSEDLNVSDLFATSRSERIVKTWLCSFYQCKYLLLLLLLR